MKQVQFKSESIKHKLNSSIALDTPNESGAAKEPGCSICIDCLLTDPLQTPLRYLASRTARPGQAEIQPPKGGQGPLIASADSVIDVLTAIAWPPDFSDYATS